MKKIKNKGIMLIDTLVALSLYLGVVLSLGIIISKNMKLTSNLYSLEEEKRLINNIKNIVKRDVDVSDSIISNISYNLSKDNKYFYLLSKFSQEENLGKIKYFKEDEINNIEAKKEKIYIGHEKIGEVWVLEIKIKDEIKTYII